MTPFDITIEITEATQCHHVVSQLLRVFPKLRLTITVQDETIPASACPPQACHADDHCLCASCRSLRRSLDAIRYLGAAYCAAEIGRLGANEAGKTSCQWKPGEHTEAAADARLKADERAARIEATLAAANKTITKIQRGDNHPDPDCDDSAYQ